MAFSQCGGTHAVSLVCWLCSDKVAWWREARVKAGLSEEPPNAHPNRIPLPEPEPVHEVTYVCIECGITITARSKGGRCLSCTALRSVAVERAKAARAVRQTPLGERYVSRFGPTDDEVDAAWEEHPEMSRAKVERLVRAGLLKRAVPA